MEILDEKNGVNYLVIMFTPRVIVIKMSKMAHFLYFLLTPKPIILKELDKIFQMHLNILPKLWLIFCCHQQKIQKMIHF